MKRLPVFLLFLIAFNFIACAQVLGQSEDESKIFRALLYQKDNYPFSQYRDVYKNFMQDYFGPGHILTDTTASAKYLQKELRDTDIFEGPDYEPTGFNGNFYRVNLRLLADGTIPYNTFFDCFVESVQSIVPPTGDEWMEIWESIDRVIAKTGWTFENEEQDRTELSKQFSCGNYIVHHSNAFDDNTNFHYRIISKENFNNIILPIIESKKESGGKN